MASSHQQAFRRDPAPSCDLAYITRALGLPLMGSRALIARIDALIAQRGFPKPLPSMRRRRPGEATGQLTDEVTTRSTWLVAAVTAWLDNYMPPSAQAAVDAASIRAAAIEMDGNARRLKLVGGGRA
ncbi:hypothetical protein [Novosphingobium rosa]|uniref:hypothetical protein n=1 Tax=Novosphingobium rosa TaxID=76978 RepID=UPI0008339523|nr:hypothetical protein [Novosphingobium rosa]